MAAPIVRPSHTMQHRVAWVELERSTHEQQH
jgi:hypothetical protein